MNANDEILDRVDDADQVIGQATRGEIHARRWKHRAVHVLLFNPRGELYVQQRAATKDTFPGCHDSSASGHLEAGEDYARGARRELREELGLVVPSVDWEELFRIAACAETGWEFTAVWRVRSAEPPAPNPAELAGGAFQGLADIAATIARHPDQYAPSFRRVFAEYRNRCKAGGFPV